MSPQKITEFAKLLRRNGDKILSSEFTLTLSGLLLSELNEAFTLITTNTIEIGPTNNGDSFQVLPPNNATSPVFADLQLIYDFIQKTTLLRIVQYPGEESFIGKIDISKFRALRRLELQKTPIAQIKGMQALRPQLQQLVCLKSLNNVDEVIAECGGDHSNGFVWNELKLADFSYNGLQTIDSALEFAQYLQHLNISHNQLVSATAVKWLPHLKTLDLSFNRLTFIPQLHMEANKRLQTLNISNNYVEDLLNLTKLEALNDLNLSDNCLLDHTSLLPISVLINLSALNLIGNPLECHPKHRLATSQFLHKNTSTVKFVLDFEPLTKHEKSITGTQQLRLVGSLNRLTYATNRSNSAAAINVSRLTPITMHTPASSVGSMQTFKFESQVHSDGEAMNSSICSMKKRTVRTVEIDEHVDDESKKSSISEDLVGKQRQELADDFVNQVKSLSKDLNDAAQFKVDAEHLAEKRQTEELRQKYGADWLKFREGQTLKTTSSVVPKELQENEPTLSSSLSRKLFNDYLGEYSTISTPKHAPQITADIEEAQNKNDDTQNTFYSAMEMQSDDQQSVIVEEQLNEVEEKEKTEDIYQNIYADDEPEISEPEDDEATYIVSNKMKPKETLFLTISSNFIREKDTITQRTKAKWSLKILESCERLRHNTLRINFDTVKVDRQERVYIVEEDLCLELERKLRDILARRDWSEMNQTMYRCVKCSCTFSQETKNYKLQKGNDVCCPQCKSSFFVAQIHDVPLKPPLVAEEPKLSPASIVEASPINMPLVVESLVVKAPDTSSIVGSGVSMRHNASNTLKYGSYLQHYTKSSANSLNESSSCSKISNSQSSFDSNQSMVGSSNTDREQDFKATVESDVDIISNPSQSSIEVLDHTASRKSSEERRFFTPNLPTIDDQSYTQHCIERYYTNNGEGLPSVDLEDDFDDSNMKTFETSVDKSTQNKSNKNTTLHNLTESSSSGSVTDSVCTTYEQQHHNETDIIKSPDSDISSSVFGAFLQSTNSLMSSSKKKQNDKDLKPNITTCQPFKFNYNDFTDVDHRLKFFLYQSKFMEPNENFKWIVRGQIYNAKTNVHCNGIIVLSNCKWYVLEAYAMEQEDVSKWLKEIVSVKLECLQQIQILPWKMGFSFQLQECGELILLMQDEIRKENLLTFLNTQSWPNCKLIVEPQKSILNIIANLAPKEDIRGCTILNDCVVTSDIAKRALNVCALIITDTHLYLSSSKMSWLASSAIDESIEVCVIQFMSNLVDVDTNTPKTVTFNFLDETQNKCELWCCHFETQETAHKCLKNVSQSWEKLFGVSLVTG